MKRIFPVILLSVVHFSVHAQKLAQFFNADHPEWKAEVVAQHGKGSWLTGAGITLIGVTAKAGYFASNRFWIGAEGEIHHFLSDRREGGLFARHYLWNSSLISGFAEGGVSYGRFQEWDWDFDDKTPGTPPPYQSGKLTIGFGLEFTLSRRIAIEGVGKVGKLTDVNWFQPSVQASLNVYLGR